ncbi:MAG: protein translocase subunit SecD [Candidatus Omnitrophota bacterium]
MSKEIGWKLIFILAIIVICVVLFYPPKDKINLGLDLKGGMHLVYRVEAVEAVQKNTESSAVRLRTLLKEASIKFDKVVRQGVNKIDLMGTNPQDESSLKNIIEDNFREWDVLYSVNGATLTLRPNVEMNMKDQAAEQALETIRNRVDEFGVSEPIFQREGEDRLMIQLPGVSDKEKSRVMGLINSTALLEFKKVMDMGPYQSEKDALQKYNGVLPEDLQILKWGGKSEYTGLYSVVQAANVITGRDLKSAKRSTDGYGAPEVAFSLNPDGASRFHTFTAANVGQKLAIVLDNRIITAPVINGPLSADSVIQGNFTREDADDMALKLRSGALPARLTLLHEQIIGPSLGADSIRKGLLSCLVGLLLVVAFMLWYYKAAGVNSVIALLLNLIILLGLMASIKATLTLPGIAGIILTMGMAVDANVLIFERIKEDMRLGKAPKAAIDSGFKKAFITIFDSNLTTVIAALFLIQFGTSSIKGFAITLIIGIAASMFTAVWVSRVIFDLTYSGKKKLEKISI